MIGIVLVALILSKIIIIHEFGHYIFARIFGVGVEVFSVGFGKPLVSYKDSRGTKWQICVFPLGGYIQPKDEGDAVGKRFIEASPLSGMLVALAGPLFNFLTAFIWLALIANYSGFPEFSNQISYIVPNSIAEKSGLKQGDVVESINNKQVKSILDVMLVKKANFIIKRNKKEMNIEICPDSKTKSYGIIFSNAFVPVTFIESITKSANFVAKNVYETTKKSANCLLTLNFRGPVGIMHQAMKQREKGLETLFLFGVALSIGVGAFNLLPLPALDGGMILMFIISALIGRPAPNFVLKYFNYVGIAVICVISIITLIMDVQKLI